MKSLLLVINLVLVGTPVDAQNPEGFDGECKKNISGTVPLAYANELYKAMNRSNIIILDAREENEYEISHLPKAQHIGFAIFDSKLLSSYQKTDTIYVYCSIGYRSEKTGERIQKMGFNNVFNLYGGIFNWANFGYRMVDKNNEQTKSVHGYDKKWSKLLNEKRCYINMDD